MDEKRINVVTFGKPDGYKSLHIGHLAGGALHADLFYRYCLRMQEDKKCYLISGTDGFGATAFVECWKAKGAKPTNTQLQSYVEEHYQKQKNDLAIYGIFPDYYGNDTEPQNAREIASMCDRALEKMVNKGLCVLRDDIEYIDPIYGIAIGERFLNRLNDGTLISNLSKQRVVAHRCKNWFLDLDAAKPIIEESIFLYDKVDTQVVKYVKQKISSKLGGYRLTSYQPWALPVGDHLRPNDNMKYQVWYASLIEPLLYSINGVDESLKTLEDLKNKASFVQFIADDNIFFYSIIRPVLWNAVTDSNIIDRLVYFQHRNFMDEKGEKFFCSAADMCKDYNPNIIRLYFLTRGRKSTTFHLNTEELNRCSRFYNRYSEKGSDVQKGRDSCVSTKTFNSSVQILRGEIGHYLSQFDFQKSFDQLEYSVKKYGPSCESCRDFLEMYIPI